MPTTGIDISRWFDEKVDKAYSDYLDNTKKNRLFKFAFIEAVEKKDSGNDTQFELDELNVLTKTEQEFPVTNGELLLSDIPLYLHLKAMDILTRQYMGDISEIGDTYIVMKRQCGITTGERILIDGVNVPAAANGEFFVKKVGVQKYLLFTDEALTAPVSFGPLYYGGGKVHKLMWRQGKNYYEDTKISFFSKPTPIYPKYEQSEQRFKIRPADSLRVSVDYYTLPPQFIDVTSTFDYETLYSLPLLKYLVNVAVKLFSQQTKDMPGYNVAVQDIVNNP